MALWWTHYGDGAPISIITSISIFYLQPRQAKWLRVAAAEGFFGEWWGSEPRSVTNTDRCTLGWAIIWTCIKTIYKQCNWAGSGGDAVKVWTGWQIFESWQQREKRGFINFLRGCNWIFERGFLFGSRAHLTTVTLKPGVYWLCVSAPPFPPPSSTRCTIVCNIHVFLGGGS